ncbi:MAG: M15 family metallopeptidase [Minisyncoccia bacterium]
MTDILLISDPSVLAVPIKENGEPMVDLLKIQELFVDLSRDNVQTLSKSISIARKTVADMLVVAQRNLPPGYKLMVKECHRDIGTQKKIFENYRAYLKKENHKLSDEELYREASKYVAPPEIVPPHSTGGAVDLTLMTNKGKEIDMGTRFNADPLESDFSNYTGAEVPVVTKDRRKILIDAMEAAGFVNYPTEWWHWSYGDRYWAKIKGEPFAIYGTAEV